ncbi:MAG: hypothetical protein RI909_1036 [Bacteroidota bacterium]|jgi:hypothetical protein
MNNGQLKTGNLFIVHYQLSIVHYYFSLALKKSSVFL